MSIRRDQLPATAADLWRAVTQLQREARERAAQLLPVLRRQDGSIALQLGDGWALLDRQGQSVVGEDTAAGAGLARPYISADAWFGAAEAPSSTTGSTTFTTLQHLPYIRQHAAVTAYYLAQTSSATTGELRLVDDSGAPIGPVVSIGAGVLTNNSVTGIVPGTFGQATYLHWQARVTGGTGTIGIRGLTTYGVQS